MITFEKVNGIKVIAIDTTHCTQFPECSECIFYIDTEKFNNNYTKISEQCQNAKCQSEDRADCRNVFFQPLNSKKFFEYVEKYQPDLL
jgi:hypothetical protein